MVVVKIQGSQVDVEKAQNDRGQEPDKRAAMTVIDQAEPLTSRIVLEVVNLDAAVIEVVPFSRQFAALV